MEVLILSVVAAFLTGGVYLLLDRTLLRVVVGTGLLSNGVNLLLFASGGLTEGSPPILHGGHDAIVDPLPQALILTAIVIGFGITALLLTLAFRTRQAFDSDDLGDLHGRLHDE